MTLSCISAGRGGEDVGEQVWHREYPKELEVCSIRSAKKRVPKAAFGRMMAGNRA